MPVGIAGAKEEKATPPYDPKLMTPGLCALQFVPTPAAAPCLSVWCLRLSACFLTGEAPFADSPFVLEGDLPFRGDADCLLAAGRVWELPTGAVSLGGLFHGLSDRWKGRCLVGLRRAGDLEADRPEIGATAEPPMVCCS